MSHHLESTASFLSSIDMRLRTADLPDDVVHEATRVIIDTMGVMLAGASDPRIQRMARGLSRTTGNASIVGSTSRLEMGEAALINGTAGVWHDFDAGHRFVNGHPAVHVLAAALPVAEVHHQSGLGLLRAFITGYEVAMHIGRLVTLRTDLHPHGSWPTVGAAAAAAQLCQLPREAVEHTLNASTSLIPVNPWTATSQGATVRNVAAGLGARAGVIAAELVKQGFTGENDAFPEVFGRLFGTSFDVSRAVEPQSWSLLDGYLKPHACARYLHPSLDALALLMAPPGSAANAIAADAISDIRVTTFELAASFDNPRPKNTLAARFSLPWAIATLLVRGTTGLDAFDPHRRGSDTVVSMAERVQVCGSRSMTEARPERQMARVEITKKDGAVSHSQVDMARGENRGSPLTDEELDQKFLRLAARSLRRSTAQALLRRLRALAEEPGMDELQECWAGVR